MDSKTVSKFASPSPSPRAPSSSSKKTVLAGGLVAFLVVGGAAALGYRFVDSKIKRIEDLGKRLNDLSVAKGDVESLLRRSACVLTSSRAAFTTTKTMQSWRQTTTLPRLLLTMRLTTMRTKLLLSAPCPKTRGPANEKM